MPSRIASLTESLPVGCGSDKPKVGPVDRNHQPSPRAPSAGLLCDSSSEDGDHDTPSGGEREETPERSPSPYSDDISYQMFHGGKVKYPGGEWTGHSERRAWQHKTFAAGSIESRKRWLPLDSQVHGAKKPQAHSAASAPTAETEAPHAPLLLASPENKENEAPVPALTGKRRRVPDVDEDEWTPETKRPKPAHNAKAAGSNRSIRLPRPKNAATYYRKHLLQGQRSGADVGTSNCVGPAARALVSAPPQKVAGPFPSLSPNRFGGSVEPIDRPGVSPKIRSMLTTSIGESTLQRSESSIGSSSSRIQAKSTSTAAFKTSSKLTNGLQTAAASASKPSQDFGPVMAAPSRMPFRSRRTATGDCICDYVSDKGGLMGLSRCGCSFSTEAALSRHFVDVHAAQEARRLLKHEIPLGSAHAYVETVAVAASQVPDPRIGFIPSYHRESKQVLEILNGLVKAAAARKNLLARPAQVDLDNFHYFQDHARSSRMLKRYATAAVEPVKMASKYQADPEDCNSSIASGSSRTSSTRAVRG